MKKPYSPKLRAVIHEIEGVLKKNDVGGIVLLSDGESHTEYRLFIDTPTWSTIRFLKEGTGIHFKAYAKSMPVETNRTVNMIWGQLDVLGMLFMTVDKIKDMVKNHLRVESSKGSVFHGPYDDEPRGDS